MTGWRYRILGHRFWDAEVPPPSHLTHIVLNTLTGLGGEALGSVVHARESKAILCQSVEMGRIHLTAVATDIGKAHVVHQDEYYIGALFRER